MQYNNQPLSIEDQINLLAKKNRIKELFKRYPDIDLTQIGLPENWESDVLWN